MPAQLTLGELALAVALLLLALAIWAAPYLLYSTEIMP